MCNCKDVRIYINIASRPATDNLGVLVVLLVAGYPAPAMPGDKVVRISGAMVGPVQPGGRVRPGDGDGHGRGVVGGRGVAGGGLLTATAEPGGSQ